MLGRSTGLIAISLFSRIDLPTSPFRSSEWRQNIHHDDGEWETETEEEEDGDSESERNRQQQRQQHVQKSPEQESAQGLEASSLRNDHSSLQG